MANQLFDVTNNKLLQGALQSYTVGAGLEFDGINDFVTVPDSTSLDLEYTDDFSLSVWLNSNEPFSSLGSDRGFNKFVVGQVGYDFLFYRFNNEYVIGLAFWQASGTASKFHIVRLPYVNIPTSNFHIVIVKNTTNPTNWAVYIDNVLQSPTNVINNSDTSILNNLPVLMNTQAGTTDYTPNTLYDLKLIKKALTLTEIERIYDTKGMIIPSTVASTDVLCDYRFNQKSGTILQDNSIYANNGTLINFANTTPSVGNAWVDDLGNSILI